MNAEAPRRRLNIDRLELDLRGIDPATAQAAVRTLGPALTRALAQRAGPFASTEHVDAGRMASSAAPAVHDLATGMAQRIARSLGGSRK